MQNNLTKHAHNGGWQWGVEGFINISISTLNNNKEVSIATGNILSLKSGKLTFENLCLLLLTFRAQGTKIELKLNQFKQKTYVCVCENMYVYIYAYKIYT